MTKRWLYALLVFGMWITAPALARLPGLTPTLAGDGLTIGPAGKLLPFGTPKTNALRQLTQVLGKPLSQRTIDDCGQGTPMTEVRYQGGVTVTVLRGKFSGWDLDEKGKLKTDRGLANGASRAMLKRVYPRVEIDDGSLGTMFTTDSGVMGFLEADTPTARVVGMFAGETCKAS